MNTGCLTEIHWRLEMDDQDYLTRLENEFRDLLEKYPNSSGKAIEDAKQKVAQKLVLWHAVHGSHMFDTERLIR